jgi:antitoxin ParD1/3/4
MEDIMPTMNVSLPVELADFVEQEVASGDYGTASEVVRESLRMLKREKAARDEKLTILRREVGIGLAQAKEGRLSKQSISDIAESLRNGSSK